MRFELIHQGTGKQIQRVKYTDEYAGNHTVKRNGGKPNEKAATASFGIRLG
jgi:hypothetical protein